MLHNLNHECIHALHCLVWGVKPNLRDEGCLYFEWQNTPQPSVTEALDFGMIGSWSLFVCCMHFYIELQPWLLRLSRIKSTIDSPRAKGHTPLSPLHDWESSHAYTSLKFHAIHSLSLLLSKTRFCRDFWPTGSIECRPAIGEWLMTSSAADGYFQWPVDISSSRWCSTVFKGYVPELWQFSEKQGSENRGSSVMAMGFRARWIEHASFAHPEAGLGPSLFCIYFV